MAMCRVGARCGDCGESIQSGKVEVRTCKYLNNIVEQDHRAIKRRCASMAGFKSFENASIALSGIELAHRIRKRQFSFGRGRPPRRSLKAMWAMAMA
jgi:transposase-like protein